MSQIENNPFPYSDTNKRYQTISWYFKNRFKQKCAKIPLNAGFSCPNRDGTKSTGGCLFCSAKGSGDTILAFSADLKKQFEENLDRIYSKWPNALGIPYFQAFSNTHAPFNRLQEIYEPFLKDPEIPALCIATRADVIHEDFIAWISRFDKEIWIELGIQSENEKTREALNICTTNQEIEKAVSLIHQYGLKVCLHIINGLPYESREQMLKTAAWCKDLKADGIKFHMLQIIEDAPLVNIWKKEPFRLLEQDEYVSIVCDQLEILPAEMVIERITSDMPADTLIAPAWSTNKTVINNEVDKLLYLRNSYQGKRA